MNVDTGHLKRLVDLAAREREYEVVPPYLADEANQELGNRTEAFVDLTKPGPLSDWAATMRKDRKKNR